MAEWQSDRRQNQSVSQAGQGQTAVRSQELHGDPTYTAAHHLLVSQAISRKLGWKWREDWIPSI